MDRTIEARGAVAGADSGWMSIVDRVRTQAGISPDAIAVEARGDTLTYAALVARMNDLALRLAPHVTTAETTIAVCLERSVDLPAWLLAIFAAGAAYVPIDPALPPARMLRILAVATPSLVLASRSLVDLIPESSAPLLIADVLAVASATPALSRPPVTERSLAYVMFTSGSTGMPKGVEIEHGGITALLDAFTRGSSLQRGETMLGLTRASFDVSVLDLFLPLTTGARLVLLELDEVADGRRLALAIARHQPDLMQATPATWRALLDAGWSGLRTLRAFCGGEAMPRDLADRLLPRCRDLWNTYGPTEATVWSTCHRVGAGTGPVPIGAAIDGTSIRIVDADGRAVEDGSVGEVLICGAGVGRGYRGDVALTAERFLAIGGSLRAYRTGDLGRVGEDGLLYCLGRVDDQVKVRGFRMELGDVEGALSQHPAVAWSAARACRAASGDTVLAGYVVPRDGAVLSVRDIKTFLASILPPYMIPDRIVTLDEMPLTPNRKIDRAALPDPFVSTIAVAVAGPAITDTGSVEHRLAAIWRELLQIDQVGPDDDFFDLGGYSLITIRLLCHIEESFDRSLEVADLLNASTLAAMAALVADAAADAADPVMLLNAGGDGPPLYWLDAGPLMRGMARTVAAGQPIYSLNLTRNEERALARDGITVPAIATTLCKRLLEARPDGPYRIGGWCRWGIVAQELACQLRQRGHDVALLVLLDAEAPRGESRYRRLRRDLARLGDLLPWRTGSMRAQALPSSFGDAVLDAGCRHVPRRFHGRALLIRAADARYRRGGGWTPWAGHLVETRTTGNHESMVRTPHVADLGAILDRHLVDEVGTRLSDEGRLTGTVAMTVAAFNSGYAVNAGSG